MGLCSTRRIKTILQKQIQITRMKFSSFVNICKAPRSTFEIFRLLRYFIRVWKKYHSGIKISPKPSVLFETVWGFGNLLNRGLSFLEKIRNCTRLSQNKQKKVIYQDFRPIPLLNSSSFVWPKNKSPSTTKITDKISSKIRVSRF